MLWVNRDSYSEPHSYFRSRSFFRWFRFDLLQVAGRLQLLNELVDVLDHDASLALRRVAHLVDGVPGGDINLTSAKTTSKNNKPKQSMNEAINSLSCGDKQ